jgi:hypothetical protein
MTTTNPPPADTEPLESMVRQRLAGRVHVHDLRVLILEHGLVLEGRVATYYAKQLAQHEAMAVTGLPLHANRIAVQ